MGDGWDWVLTTRARREFDALDDASRNRIASKLDDIVNDEWREPTAHLEPLRGASHSKLRVGPFRLGCRADLSSNKLYVLRIQRRGQDAYQDDD